MSAPGYVEDPAAARAGFRKLANLPQAVYRGIGR